MKYLKNKDTGVVVEGEAFGRSFRNGKWEVLKGNFLNDHLAADQLNKKKDEVDAEAVERVNSSFSVAKQLSLFANAFSIQDAQITSLNNGENHVLSAEELIVLDELKACKDLINLTTTKSAEIKASLQSKNLMQLLEFDHTENSLWQQ